MHSGGQQEIEVLGIKWPFRIPVNPKHCHLGGEDDRATNLSLRIDANCTTITSYAKGFTKPMRSIKDLTITKTLCEIKGSIC